MPKKFKDHYEDAFKELLRKKQRGEKMPRDRESHQSNGRVTS
jgi:non-homologous end joining protein Ku